MEPEATCEIDVIADRAPRIVVDGEVLWSDGVVEDLVAGFEQWLYRLALARHKRRFVVFHAAALASDTKTFVFSGPSGAGKSSLALADGTDYVIPSHSYWNTSADYAFDLWDTDMRIRFGINNVTDERAPLADRFFGYFADAHRDYGRSYYLDVRMAW